MPEINICIDCPPGYTRPNLYFKNIIEKLNETYSENVKITKFIQTNKNLQQISSRFGSWEWVIKIEECDTDIIDIIKSHFKIELTKLYQAGAIRFGSWE
jgi:hypothetical protein